MKRTVSVKVLGKVQGVFFRASTKEQADRLGLTGRVRNERDGSVYIEAQGEEHNLLQFIDWCKKGPPLAEVASCDVEFIQPKDFHDFRIER